MASPARTARKTTTKTPAGKTGTNGRRRQKTPAPRTRPSPRAAVRRAKQRLMVVIGTRKGAFLYHGDTSRQKWEMDGPHFPGWAVQHLSFDRRTGSPGSLFAALSHDVYGTNIHRSADLGATWQMADGPVFPPDSGKKLVRLWRVEPGHASRPNEVWAGGDPAALFKSEDGGLTWRPMAGINEHPTRDQWFPGAGGLMVHCILIHPTNPDCMYVAISAAGVFRTDDGGQTWQPRNQGTWACFNPEGQQWPQVGQCCHHLVMSPADPDVLFQQNHCGVYATNDGGASWSAIDDGLPARFGFPIGISASGSSLYVVPEVSDEYRYAPNGEFAVYRSRSLGQRWQKLSRGLPRQEAYLNVFREGLATDDCEPGGVYVGTSTGEVFYSRDEGDHWHTLAQHLPPVYCVAAAVLD
jgi:photosystem II stability/assembly factor-like uncharacterized protein